MTKKSKIILTFCMILTKSNVRIQMVLLEKVKFILKLKKRKRPKSSKFERGNSPKNSNVSSNTNNHYVEFPQFCFEIDQRPFSWWRIPPKTTVVFIIKTNVQWQSQMVSSMHQSVSTTTLTNSAVRRTGQPENLNKRSDRLRTVSKQWLILPVVCLSSQPTHCPHQTANSKPANNQTQTPLKKRRAYNVQLGSQ